MQRALFFTSLLLSLSVAAEESLLELSLEELLEIDLSGDSVKTIDLKSEVFTSNPFNQPIINLPFSIEVLNSESISAKGIKNIVQVVQNFTGVLSGESPSEPYSFSARGFSRDSIDVVYDGISMGLSTLNMRPQSTFNIEQVEFIKGPATFTNGQGAAGGTVNIITKKAKLVDHHTREVLFTAGDYNTKSYNIAFAGPISENIAYRLDLSRNNSDGWVDNTRSFTTNISASFLWKINEQLETLFSVLYLDDELPAYWGTPFVPQNISTSSINSVIDADNGLVIDKKTRFINYNVSDHEISSSSLWNKIDIKWQPNDILNASATFYLFNADRDWRNSESYFFNPEISRVERDRLLVAHDRENWGFIGEINYQHELFSLSSKSSFTLEWLDTQLKREVGFNLSSSSLYWDSVDLLSPEAGLFGHVDYRYDSLMETNIAFVFNNLTDIYERLSLTTKLRYEQIDYTRNYINWDGTVRGRATIDTTFHEYSYFIGLTHKLSDHASLYGQYSFSHDPVFNDYRFVYDAENLSPSDVTQFEIGYKSLFESGDTEMTIALFQINKKVDTQISVNSGVFSSKRNSEGIEFSINSNISSQFLVGGHFSYINASFEEYYDPEWGFDVSGKQPINTPKLMANIGFSYLLESLPIEIGGGVNYVSARKANGTNTIELKPYSTQSLYISYLGHNYHLALHINNLNDDVYGPWSDIYYPNQVILSAPRMVELSYRMNF